MCDGIQILLELTVPWSAIKVDREFGGPDTLEVQSFYLPLAAVVHIPLPAIRKTFTGESRRPCCWTYPSRLPRAKFNDPRRQQPLLEGPAPFVDWLHWFEPATQLHKSDRTKFTIKAAIGNIGGFSGAGNRSPKNPSATEDDQAAAIATMALP
jgi:hypothetical protein